MSKENSLVKQEEKSIVQSKQVQDVLNQINMVSELMEKALIIDKHYGLVPGCGKKPTLLKPGSEKLMMLFQLSANYSIEEKEYKNGHKGFNVTTNLTSRLTGIDWGSGLGFCSTAESKWRFRWDNTKKLIPKEYWDRGQDKSVIGGDRFTHRKAWANNKQDWYIFERVEHDNPADNYNTCLKMAKKRALVDAVLTATGASDLFTQDIEDMSENDRKNQYQNMNQEPDNKKPPTEKKTKKSSDKNENKAKEELMDLLFSFHKVAETDNPVLDIKETEKLVDADLKRLTGFHSKRDNKWIDGVDNINICSPQRAGIALKKFREEREADTNGGNGKIHDAEIVDEEPPINYDNAK